MPATEGTNLVRRQLGRRLRGLRKAAHKSEHDVVESGIVSRASLWRIETGRVPVKIGTVRGLCWLYGADNETTDALAALALGSTAEGWWEDRFADVLPSWFKLYLDLEAAADQIRTYDAELVHGLLQTADYARAVYQAAQPNDDEEEIQRHVQVRLERQRTVFDRESPVRLTAIISEGALARVVGSNDIMVKQMAHLRKLASRKNVDIRVLTFVAGAHAAMLGDFALLDFADTDDPSIAYLESQVGARYLEKKEEVAEYRRIFELIYKQTKSLKEYLK